MARTLAVVAGAGIAVSAVCLSIAAALGADDDWGDLPFGLDNERCRVDVATPETRSFAWNGGDSISIRVPADIQYRRGTGDAIIATGPAELLDQLRIGRRSINLDCSLRGPLRDALTITLPGQEFRKFAVNGSGHLHLHDLDQPHLELALNGSGMVEANGSTDDVSVEIGGSGDAKLQQLAVGRLRLRIAGSGDVQAAPTETADVSIAGSGDADLGSGPLKTLRLRIMGSGGAEAAPQEAANIDIAGSGDVLLHSKPRELVTHVAGSGKVITAPGTP